MSMWQFLSALNMYLLNDFPDGTVAKNPPANAGVSGDTRDTVLIPGSGRSSGVGNGNPRQYSCPENTTDRGAWWATDYGVAKSQTWLSDWAHAHTHTYTHTHTHMTEQRVKSCPEGWEKTSHLHWVKESLLVKYRKAAFVLLLFNQRGLNPPFFWGVSIRCFDFWSLLCRWATHCTRYPCTAAKIQCSQK